jgi:AhpC/TSA family
MSATFLSINLIALWSMVLVNLLLTLRAVRWLRAGEELRARLTQLETAPLLPVGEPAPDFHARTLSGEPVRLADYADRAVAFVFVSPQCGGCRRELPALARLGPLARRRAGVELVLVSDRGAAETHEWLDTIRHEDGVDVGLGVLVAPPAFSDLLAVYNPRGLVPYFCLVDERGVVQARDPLGMGEWPRLRRTWEAVTPVRPTPWRSPRGR